MGSAQLEKRWLKDLPDFSRQITAFSYKLFFPGSIEKYE